MGKILTLIVLAGMLAFGSAGCSLSTSSRILRVDHSKYKYDGKIGEDQVKFTETLEFNAEDDNMLTVTKPDGRVITYVDRLGDDLKLEYVDITKDNQTVRYTPDNEIGKPILEEAQKQFDAYMKKVKEIKIKQGIENLK